MLVLAPIYHLAPAVVNHNLQRLYLPVGALRHIEVVVDAVRVGGGDGGGKIKMAIAAFHCNSVGGDAQSIRCGNPVNPRLIYSDLRGGLACAPEVVRQVALCQEFRLEILAKVIRQQGDFKVVVHAVKCHGDDGVAAV